jgi:hypothetical protein
MSSNSDALNTTKIILRELAEVFEPIGEAMVKAGQGNEDEVEYLLEDMGLHEGAIGSNYDALKKELERLADPWSTIDAELVQPIKNDEFPELGKLDDVFKALKKLIEVLGDLDDVEVEDPDIEQVGELILDYLLIVYLYDNYPGIHSVLSLVGVIKMEGPGDAGDLDLSEFGNVFSNPQDYVDDVFSWGTEEFEPFVVIFYLKGLVDQFGFEGSFAQATGQNLPQMPDIESVAQDVVEELLTYLLDGADVPADVEKLAEDIAADVVQDISQGQVPDHEELLKKVAEKTAQKLKQELEQELKDELGEVPDEKDLREELPVGQPTKILQDRQLEVNMLAIADDNASAEAGIILIPVPGQGGLPGLIIKPYGSVGADVTEKLDECWTFNAQFSGNASWAVTVVPDSSGNTVPELFDVNSGNVKDEARGEASITYDCEEEGLTPIIGDPTDTGIGVRYFQASITIEYKDGEVVVLVEVPAKGHMHVTPKGPFLEKVMPEGIGYDFDATVGWASDTGLFFERGGSLEMSIPSGKQIGPMVLEEIYGALEPGDGATGGGGGGGGGGSTAGSSSNGSSPGGPSNGGTGGPSGNGSSSGGPSGDASFQGGADVDLRQGTITIQGAISGSAELGPFTAKVRRIGVEADMSFPKDGGNVGPAQVDIGFKPPEGVGLSIDAGAVSGGGYLQFDPDNDRYAGVLQLKVQDISINVVGLLTTDLPGGDDGFSLLLIISGEFPPVQLGMGFTLNGVGGLVGVNRTVKSDPLANAVREGSMDSILFPENPIANSDRIISDLRAIFPPRSDTHVFGPIVRLGWGTPTLITADVGVILEVPTWRIILLGRLSAALPDEKAALIELNLAVRGELDPPNQSLAIDATLYDSRVLAWSLSGDMALRSNWGDDPRFVLSVGGFNPRFPKPGDFPELRRVRASLGPPSGNPSLEYYGYFALTSNTVQAGAGVKLRASAGPAKVKGKLQFDALIKFDPFGFIIDFHASLSVTIKGKGLSIRLDGTLKGPSPFEISGTLKIEILFITVTANVDVTLGSDAGDEGLPPAKVMPELVDALGKTKNWSAGRPGAANSMATLREPEGGDEVVFAHPLAEVGVRQTVVPLEFELEKYGNAAPTGLDKFSIDSASVSGGAKLDLGAKTTEQFAPAQFRKLSDQEKLDSPPFTSEVAGQKMDHEGIYVGDDTAENVRTARLGFESSIIDKTNDNRGEPLANLGGFALHGKDSISTISPDVADGLSNVSAVANSPIRTTGAEQFRIPEAEMQAYREQLAGVPTIAKQSTADVEGVEYEEMQVVRGGMTPEEGGLSVSVSVDEGSYVVASKTTLEQVDIPTIDAQPTSKEAARRGLSELAETNPAQADKLQVVEAGQARTNGTDGTTSAEESTSESDSGSSTASQAVAGEMTVTLGETGQQYTGGNQ